MNLLLHTSACIFVVCAILAGSRMTLASSPSTSTDGSKSTTPSPREDIKLLDETAKTLLKSVGILTPNLDAFQKISLKVPSETCSTLIFFKTPCEPEMFITWIPDKVVSNLKGETIVLHAKKENGAHEALIKVMDEKTSKDSNYMDLKAAMEFRHENVVAFYGYKGTIGSGPTVIAMELAELGSLFDIWKNAVEKPNRAYKKEAKRIFNEIVRGLLYLKSKGWYHGNVLLSNVLVFGSGSINYRMHVKLTEFSQMHKVDAKAPSKAQPDLSSLCAIWVALIGIKMPVYPVAQQDFSWLGHDEAIIARGLCHTDKASDPWTLEGVAKKLGVKV